MKVKIICILVMTLLITTTLSVVGQTNDSKGFVDADQELVPGKMGIPISDTFYGTSSDGTISKFGLPYSSVRDGNEGTVESGTPCIIIGQFQLSGVYTILRSYIFFDTSSIPDSITIDSAVLSLYGCGDDSERDFSVMVQNGQPTYPHDPLQAGDFNRNHYSGTGGSLLTQYFTTSGYNDIDLNNDGISWINKQGTTKFCLRSSRDINGDAPTIYEMVSVYAAEGSYKPKLTVVYANEAPDIPDRPYGPTTGNPNVEYTYITKTSDPEGDQVFYQWRWGDGTQSDWLGPYNSGEEASAIKMWTAKGTYSVTVKAKDTNGAESDWSNPLSVTIPRDKATTNLFLSWLVGQFPMLQLFLQNLGL